MPVGAAPFASASAAGLLLLLGASLTSCSSTGPGEFEAEPQREVNAGRNGAYGAASTPDDLKRLLSEDLEAGFPDRALSGLEAFAGDNVQAQTVTRGRLVWEAVRPVTMLQFNGGRAQMTAAKALEKMLVGKAEAEMKSAFNSLRTGDFDQVKRLRDNPMGIFHPSTAAMSAEVRPYAALADGVLQYRELATTSDPSEAQLQGVLAKLQEAQSALATIGDGEAAFLADSAAAQSLERAGQIDAAAEFWMRIADSDQFASQPPLMRNLVAARIKSYRVRLRESVILEVEDDRRAELRAQSERYESKVDGLEEKHDGFADWARSGLGAARAQLASLQAEDATQAAAIARMSKESTARDEELKGAAERLAGVVGALDVRFTENADVFQERLMALSQLTEEQQQLLAQIEGMTDAQREKIEGLVALTKEQRERQYELNQTTTAQRAQLEALAEAAQARDAAIAKVKEDVQGVDGRIDSANADADARQRAILSDLAEYRASVDELSAAATVDELEALGALADGPEEPTEEGGAAATDGVESAPKAQLPARLSFDAFPDIFGAIANAQAGVKDKVKSAAGRVSEFIQPQS